MEPTTEAMSRAGKGTAAKSEAGNARPVSWQDAQARLPKDGWSWLATVRPDARPHVMPVLAVWSGSRIYFCSKDTARKSQNLAENDHCVITYETDDLHLIVEGHARKVGDEATLRRVSDAFKTAYDWPTVVTGDKLDAQYGAPTSGGPPYDVFEVTPTKAFGLPVDGETLTPTRWRF
jgi:pyridoxamine 5'-phosphate oxidase-like protein